MRVTSTNQTGSSQGSSPVADAELAAQQALRAAAEAARLAASQNAAAGQAQAAAQRAMELLKKAQAALTEAKKQKAPAAELNRAEQAIAKASAATQQAAAALRATSTFEPGRTPPPAAQSPQRTPPQATPAQDPPATAGQEPPAAAVQGPTPGYTQEQAAKDAAEIYGATKGGLTGWGTDEDRLFKALDNKSPADIALIRQSFKEHYNLDLDQTVREELDGDDLTRANNILSGNKGAAAAATFKGQTGWFGDQEGSLKQLEAASPADRRAIARSFQQMYAKDYPDVKASTPEEFMQKALGPSLNDSQKSQLQSLLATT